MTEERNGLTDLFAACWKDDALKARFIADPKAVLAERGIEMPDGIDVNVVENSDNTVHITMPMAPDGQWRQFFSRVRRSLWNSRVDL